MFGGGNYDADDIDEWLTLQRDWQVDGGIEPATEEARRWPRASAAARAIQAVFADLGFPAVTDAEIEAAMVAHDSRDLPDRDRAADVTPPTACSPTASRASTSRCVARRRGVRRRRRGHRRDARQRVAPTTCRRRRSSSPDGSVHSAVNDPNLYIGPGTGYRLEGERWEHLQALPHRRGPVDGVGPASAGGRAAAGGRPARGHGVAGSRSWWRSARPSGRAAGHHRRPRRREVLAPSLDGIAEGGATPRLVRIRDQSDVAFIAHAGACLAGSGVGVGLQSKGTTVIHRADLQPLDNLELFGMAPA